MKKLITLLLALMLCLTAGCSKEEKPEEEAPGDVVNLYMEKEIKETIDEAIAKLKEDNSDLLSYVPEDMLNEGLEMLSDYEFEIKKENIKDDKATVDVAVTTYDFGNLLVEGIKELLSQSVGLILKGASEEDVLDIAVDIAKTKMKELKDKGKACTQNVTFHLAKNEDKWDIDKNSEPDEILNAFTGGLVDATEKIEGLFEALQ